MMRPVPRGTLALAGMGAGVCVGLVDGVRASLVVGTDISGGLMAGVLVAAVDGLIGGASGAVLEVISRAAVWGRRGRSDARSRMASIMVLGMAAAAATVAAAVGTADRRNRFLASGVAVLVALIAGTLGAALAPALARLLSRRRKSAPAVAPGETIRRPCPAFLLLAPLTGVTVGAVVFSATMGLRGGPSFSPHGLRALAVAGIEAGILPALLLWAEALPVRLRLWIAAPLAAGGVVGALVTLAVTHWDDHLRFLPWTHIVPGAAIMAVTVGTVSLVGRLIDAVPAGRLGLIGGAALGVLMSLTLVTAESETARKVTSARAGLVGPVLAAVRRGLDEDRDGYARVLGGGDCDDGDALVHPGVLDFPDDGIDQDCDGKDPSVAVLAPPPFAPVPDSVPRELNLLLVTIDTIRADHLGCYGYERPTSPAIDRLAAEGALFLNGWAHAPSTRYSMPAIATGRWPSAIAWDESIWWPRIAPEVRTLPEALKAEGYFTAAFYSYDYFSPADRRGFERGVDLYRADRAALHRSINGPMESRGSSSAEIADDAIAFFESHRAGRFFLWIHFYDPHLSYERHAEVPSFGTRRVDLYDGEIRFTDFHFGRVLERLRAIGLWSRTAVVVTGDHGEGFGEHGVTEHGFDLYAPQTKVPLIIRVPGLPARKIADPAGHVDLAPTLLNLARGGQEEAFLGRSLVGEMSGVVLSRGDSAGTAEEPQGAGSQRSSGGAGRVVFQEVTSERGKKRALVTENLHLIWNWTPDNTTECYDLRADPQERRDLWGRSTDSGCRRLKSDLQGMVAALSMPTDVRDRLKAGVFPAGAAVPAPATALEAMIGDRVRVGGFTLSSPSPSPSPSARGVSGHEVDLAVLFECKKEIRDGWRFFFHLMGPGGSFRNLDHVPVAGAMPPERWRAGQRILDRLRITFPPGASPGDYQVIVGLFRGAERLPVIPAELSNGNKALRLATIQLR